MNTIKSNNYKNYREICEIINKYELKMNALGKNNYLEFEIEGSIGKNRLDVKTRIKPSFDKMEIGCEIDIKLPSFVTCIDDYGFYGSYIKSIEFNKELKKIGSFAFANCFNLKNIGNIPENIEVLHETFKGCNSLVTPPKLNKNIKILKGTFFNCSSLAEFPDIPYGTEAMIETFFGCNSLRFTKPIPNSVTEFKKVLLSCGSLIEVYIPNNIHNTSRIVDSTADTNFIYQGKETYDKYYKR